MSGLAHPEMLADGRKLWMDGSIRELVHKIRFGDPITGWEGDDRIELYWDDKDQRFELWRCEDDGVYRRVCRSAQGVGFDERVLHTLVSWDGRRRTVSLVDEVNNHNARRDADLEAHRNEWVAEELAPRLRHALNREL